MATRHYGADFGADVSSDVTEAGAATGLHVNVSVVYDASSAASKLATLRCLNAISQAINEDTWPPV